MRDPEVDRPEVFALVCDELPERRDALEAHLIERGVRATLWKGFHGLTWGLETSKEYDPGKTLPPGHVGLNLGSWAMWQHAWQSGGPADTPVIFFEDDVCLPPDFWARVAQLRRDLFRLFYDWDLVFLGTCGQEPMIWHKVTERIGGPASRLCRLSDPFGTHAMMVRPSALPVLLRHMRAAERNLDQQLFRDVLAPGRLKWCAVLPSIVTQRTYDHAGAGRPEWAPSTLRAGEVPASEAGREAVSPDLPGRPGEEMMAATLRAIDPFPCIYRGELLTAAGTDPETGRTVPLSECARLNRPCHSTAADARLDGAPAVRCGSCLYRLEMAPAASRTRLPLPDGHFNPSMILWDGHLILATRDSWGHSKVCLWELTNSRADWLGDWAAAPLGSYGSAHPLAPRLEDPRLFVAEVRGVPRLHASFSLPDGYPPKRVKVGYVRFWSDLSGIETTEVLDSPVSNLYEKNWMPLSADGEIRWVYSYKPEHVVLGGTQNWRTPNRLAWTGGALRGGAAPVYVPPGDPRLVGIEAPAGAYYHFFHGCLKRAQGSVYTVGCNVFEARPPYRVLAQTPTPLLWPDLPAPGESVVKRYVLWPGGAVFWAGRWHLALGVDDTFCRVVSLGADEVLGALSQVPGDGPETVSVRDTHIVSGVREGDFR